jgi:outer membrane lipoprotein SlyB
VKLGRISVDIKMKTKTGFPMIRGWCEQRESIMGSPAMRAAVLVPLVLLAACATVPTGPSVMALPGTGKNFEQFRADDAECRAYAESQTGGTTAEQASVDSGIKSAAVGTAIGAAAGAAFGGHQGAGVGAGAGLIVGSMAGAGAGQASARSLQQRYDNAYIQCMYAKGEDVPVAGQTRSMPARSRYAPPPRYYAPPPPPVRYVEPPRDYVPPPGYPPPPPR